MRHTRAFTLIELVATVAALAMVGGLLACGASAPPRQENGFLGAIAAARQGARQHKDSTQMRGIHQGLVIWAQNNEDVYPLPSRIDRGNTTVAEEGRAKDTTANIFSIMVFSGLITTETLVSPLERNRNVRELRTYAFDAPRTAVDPAKAHWDPAMRAGLSEDQRGHISYAHLQPAAGRLELWSNTLDHQVALSTRGPAIRTVEQNEDGSVTPRFANPQSLTLSLMSGQAETTVWSGHIVTSDNSVTVLADYIADGRPIPARTQFRYADEREKQWPDVLFYDEADDPKRRNIFLGMFTRAGAQTGDFEAIWD